MLFEDFYRKRVKASGEVGEEFVFGKDLGGVGCARRVEEGEFLIRRDFGGGMVHYY